MILTKESFERYLVERGVTLGKRQIKFCLDFLEWADGNHVELLESVRSGKTFTFKVLDDFIDYSLQR